MSQKFWFLIIIFCVLSLSTARAMGFNEWQHVTEGGIVLHNSYGPTYIEWEGQTIKDVRNWYYYKNHIIGISTNSSHTKAHVYFILNEGNKELFETKELSKWKGEIKQRNLDPFFTRWYSSYTHYCILIIFLAVVYWFFSVPILLYVIYIMYYLIKHAIKSSFNLKSPSVQFLLYITLGTLLMYWSSINYSSI